MSSGVCTHMEMSGFLTFKNIFILNPHVGIAGDWGESEGKDLKRGNVLLFIISRQPTIKGERRGKHLSNLTVRSFF